MCVQAVTECYMVSALHNQGKKNALVIFDGDDNWNYLSMFKRSDSAHDGIPRMGELFLLNLYGAVKSKSLDKHRYIMYF